MFLRIWQQHITNQLVLIHCRVVNRQRNIILVKQKGVLQKQLNSRKQNLTQSVKYAKSNICTAEPVKTRPILGPLGDKEYHPKKVYPIRHANLFCVWFQLEFLCAESKERGEVDHLIFAEFCQVLRLCSKQFVFV